MMMIIVILKWVLEVQNRAQWWDFLKKVTKHQVLQKRSISWPD